jgi:hypothetical protein
MEKAINRKEGRVSRTTEDEFARDGFLRERMMTPSERNYWMATRAPCLPSRYCARTACARWLFRGAR